MYVYIFGTVSAFSLYGEYVVRSFLPDDGISLPCDYGLDFLHQLMREFNQNQSIPIPY